MGDVLWGYGVTSRTEIIPTGIALDRFTGGDGYRFREKYEIDPARPTLVHIGRVAFEKNIEFLLHVIVRVKQALPDVILIIAGEGPAEQRIHATIRELSLEDNVLFVGYLVDLRAVMDCYCAGDAFVFASRTETQGLVLLEAMALGVPVVSTAVMGTKDILEAQKGALVAAEDVEDFAGKVLDVLRDEGLRARLSTEGKEYVKGWTAERMAIRLIDFYQATLAGST
jgi:glycosyltransferase involved in cell wall biosynthesis